MRQKSLIYLGSFFFTYFFTYFAHNFRHKFNFNTLFLIGMFYYLQIVYHFVILLNMTSVIANREQPILIPWLSVNKNTFHTWQAKWKRMHQYCRRYYCLCVHNDDSSGEKGSILYALKEGMKTWIMGATCISI